MIKVSNIEKFATHDGPGIRTTVFLKGCSLRCPWCANPETWTVDSVLMYDFDKCVHCKTCEKNCPNIKIDPYAWNEKSCSRCQMCVKNCPASALSFNGKDMEIEDVVAEVMKDEDYYIESNGGVTISGGEPFFQYDKFLSLLKALKKQNLHIAIETTGHYPIEQLKEASEYIDLFLFDMKHVDNDKFREFTKGDLEVIRKNFEYITKKKQVIARVPVIPGFNDDVLDEIIEYAKSCGAQAVNLLPYHSMGKKKWEQLNRTYKYDGLKMMDKSELQSYASDYVKIGG